MADEDAPTPYWTIGWVGIVFHTILAASKFTWSKEDLYSCEDELYGFKFQDILYILNHIHLSETWVNQCILPSTVLALQSPLIGFYCLRLFHRAGVFSSKTGGAILRSTNLHGYLKFNHDIIHSVMRQMLARDCVDSEVKNCVKSSRSETMAFGLVTYFDSYYYTITIWLYDGEDLQLRGMILM
ncbi:unnamed protein product [Trichobilharzia regenti]|nr:unnamed protein product [Trichobilharzia regenti]